MNTRRNKKHHARAAKLFAAALFFSLLLSGCGNAEEQMIQEATAAPTATEEAEATPDVTPLLDTTPEPAGEDPLKEYDRKELDDKISFNHIQMLVFKNPEGTDKIIIAFVYDDYKDPADGEWVESYYDIHTGIKLFTEKRVRMPEDYLPHEILYIIPTLSGYELEGSYSPGTLINVYIRNHFSPRQVEQSLATHHKYIPADVWSSEILYTADEFQQYYEELLPEEYRVTTQELFPELADAEGSD